MKLTPASFQRAERSVLGVEDKKTIKDNILFAINSI
jgi:hypothetical protein